MQQYSKGKRQQKTLHHGRPFQSREIERDVCSVPVKIQQGKQYGASHSHVAWRNKLQQEQNATVLQQGEEVFEKLNKPQNASSKVPM